MHCIYIYVCVRFIRVKLRDLSNGSIENTEATCSHWPVWEYACEDGQFGRAKEGKGFLFVFKSNELGACCERL